MTTDPRQGERERSHRSTVTSVVAFLEARGIKTYAMRRTPSSIVLSLPNEPELALQHHLDDLKGHLQEVDLARRSDDRPDLVALDPRDHRAILIEIKSPHSDRAGRDTIVQTLRNEENQLRRMGIEALLLFGSAATTKPYPNDVDLLARFRPDSRLSAFDIAEIQAYLEEKIGRRVDLSNEKTFPSEFRRTAEETGVRVFGT